MIQKLEKKVNNFTINLSYNENTFKPTLTSDLLIDSCKDIIKENKNVLDLGCGIGIICIAIKKIIKNIQVYGSDISNESIKIAIKNSKINDTSIEFRQGDCFEPWNNLKFDYIFDDVSAISSVLADKSEWFSNVSCDSGIDGAILTSKIINQSADYLNSKGSIFFPIISLSNKNKILDVAKCNFKNFKMLKKKEWFLPEDMYMHKNLLEDLKNEKHIDFNYKFGKIICYTEIYQLSN
jgi:release factor glutamine methyltransferase